MTTRPALALMVLRRCNMACRHCSVESGPRLAGEPSAEALLALVREAAEAGVGTLQITGGEPMLREPVVLQLVREAGRLGLSTTMTTNGSWGRIPLEATVRLRELRRAGLGGLTVSYDRYHAEFQGPEPALNIATAAHAIGFSINLNVVREVDDAGLAELVAPFAGVESVRQRFYDVQPVGRARAFSAAALRGEDSGFCAAASIPAVTDDRRLIACNGPAYFSGRDSPLVLGSLDERPLHALLRAHRDDPVLDTIRTFGPSRLRDELKTIPGFEGFPFKDRYSGLCELCLHITSDPRAVQALRQRLAQPALVAKRIAAARVIAAEKQRGPLAWSEVNGASSRRILFDAARNPHGDWAAGAETILSRPDLDWSRLATYVARCGIGRVLLPALDSPVLSKWAPSFFFERVRAASLGEGLRELVQREALAQAGAALDRLGERGVILKGGAFLLGSPAAAPGATRATGDLDILVRPEIAVDLRHLLLDRGWTGDRDAVRSAPYHLAPVYFQGVPLEIHTHMIRAYWGVPEPEILRFVRDTPRSGAFATLDPTGFLLHAGFHTSTSVFSMGLKTAWDFHAVMRGPDAVDWERLAAWVAASRVPRAFWTPIRVLDKVLALGLPRSFWARAPADERQRRLEIVARRRLFTSTEHPDDVNRWSRNAVILLMHDTNFGRLRFLAELFDRSSRASRRANRPADERGRIRSLLDEAREARSNFSSYRRAASAAKLAGRP